MSYTVKITLPTGPTIMEADTVPVHITRHAVLESQVEDLSRAALVLGATKIDVDRNTR